MGENPMLSEPDLNQVKKSLEATEFLIVQDIFLTETAELADVVLPAACYAEKDGTFTNTERRIQRVRKAVEAPGEAKADWVIIMELMRMLGYDKTYRHPSEIMDEIGFGHTDLWWHQLSPYRQRVCSAMSTHHKGTRFLYENGSAWTRTVDLHRISMRMN